jgi:hypothetical protein
MTRRIPKEITSAIDQMRVKYRATKGTPSTRHEIGQELAAQFLDYVFEVTSHRDHPNEIVVRVWPADEYKNLYQRRT